MRPIADKQILRGAPATLSYQFTDSDGIAAAPAGAVTVGVTKADGTTVIAAGTATSGSGTSPRTYSLAAVNTLELLTVTWTDAGDASVTTQLVEVVGGYYFSPLEAREFDPTLQDTAKYPDAAIVRARRIVEERFEQITGVAWVPRYRRVRMDGDVTTIALPDPMLRSFRSIRFYTGPTTYASGDATQLAGVGAGDARDARAGIATRFDLGFWVVPLSPQSVVVEYEHGFDRPPEPLKRVAMIYCRHMLNDSIRSGVLDRSDSFQMVDGGVVRLAQPGRAGYDTGIAEVDALLQADGYNYCIPGLA